MNRTVKITIVRAMLAAGPAPIATRRRQVAAFQYASGPRASRSSVMPFSADARARGRHARDAQRVLEIVERIEARLEIVAVERSLDPVDGSRECRRILHGSRKPTLRVMRDRAVHAGDGHEAPERDRADAVLDVPTRGLRDCRRETDVEAPRTQTDRERREEVPRFVHENQQPEAEDGDEDAQTVANLPCARRRASSSASTSSSRSPAGEPSTAASASSHESRDLR